MLHRVGHNCILVEIPHSWPGASQRTQTKVEGIRRLALPAAVRLFRSVPGIECDARDESPSGCSWQGWDPSRRESTHSFLVPLVTAPLAVPDDDDVGRLSK